MDYCERIETKVGVVFKIADQCLLGQIPLEWAKEQISTEMDNIRPAQFEAVIIELAKRLKEEDCQISKKVLSELFCDYLPLPYNILEKGHPLRNYNEENSRVRTYLVKIDKMVGKEASLDAWKDVYELLNKYKVHIKRQEKNFYTFMNSINMRLQVERTKALGDNVIDIINMNKNMLENGDVYNFLFYQRDLSKDLLKYLNLEERVLYPKALITLNKQDFLELRRLDDLEGYSYIDDPVDFTPKEYESFDLLHKHVINNIIRKEDRTVDASQNIGELFVMYPKLQEDLFSLYEELGGLKGPMEMEILKEANIEMLAISLSIDTNDILYKINKLIERY